MGDRNTAGAKQNIKRQTNAWPRNQMHIGLGRSDRCQKINIVGENAGWVASRKSSSGETRLQEKRAMTNDFAESLSDLIWKRERLHADLDRELNRAQRVADFVSRLGHLNDQSESVIAATAQRLSSRPVAMEPTPIPMPRVATSPLTQAEQTAEGIFAALKGRAA